MGLPRRFRRWAGGPAAALRIPPPASTCRPASSSFDLTHPSSRFFLLLSPERPCRLADDSDSGLAFRLSQRWRDPFPSLRQPARLEPRHGSPPRPGSSSTSETLIRSDRLTFSTSIPIPPRRLPRISSRSSPARQRQRQRQRRPRRRRQQLSLPQRARDGVASRPRRGHSSEVCFVFHLRPVMATLDRCIACPSRQPGAMLQRSGGPVHSIPNLKSLSPVSGVQASKPSHCGPKLILTPCFRAMQPLRGSPCVLVLDRGWLPSSRPRAVCQH